ncbi:UV-stimulated scaffold protein A-like protein [Leptotrombidium deliense]|uniref:UV-stimulated scaffold protein A-like protein n=1 Tax=Leptotrombidium deliense TaxID=299467 RepID=A0A443S5R4_9ACAR|nr:UV-stimulated scaffold protein A-like protein [Leptotrombidium deliense]
MVEESKQLKECIEKLTTDGKATLDPSLLSKVKKLCKNGGDSSIELAVRILMSQLQRKHSQIRLSTTLLINELFIRSHCFRTNFLESNQFQYFLELTFGINDSNRLPPPKQFAKLLKEKCIEFLNSWNASFAEGYPVLKNSYAFLKDNSVVDFREREVLSTSEREAREKRATKRNQFLQAKIEKTVKQFNELEEDMKSIFVQYDSCLQLIVPKLENEEDNFLETNVNCSENENIFINGFNQSVDLTIKRVMTVNKCEDNSALIENLKDMYKLLVDYLSKVKKLLQLMSKGSELCYVEMKRAIDLKSKIMEAIQKFIELKIIETESVKNMSENSDTSDDDFETVEEKEGLELIIPENRRKEYGLCDDLSEKPSTSGDSQFVECKVPLPNGKLCPRRDKIKCPFHGKIIMRDSCGIPVNEEDRKGEKLKAEATPDWQQPELLRDIESQTGIDLRVSRKGKRKKHTGLQSIRTCDQTSRQRLAKKVFNVETVNKIADDMNAIDAKLSNQFGDQWNYFMNE